MQKNTIFNWKHYVTLFLVIIVSVYIFYSNFSIEALRFFSVNYFPYIALAFAFIVLQDCFGAFRIHLLSNKKISTKHAFIDVLLIQFANAITPPIASSTAIPMYIFNKEKIGWANSSLIVIINMILDQIMFLIFIPIFWLLFGKINILGFIQNNETVQYTSVISIITFGYFSFLMVSGSIILILFIAPKKSIACIYFLLNKMKLQGVIVSIQPFLFQLYKIRILLLHKSVNFWLQISVCTIGIWLMKFVCASILLLPFLKENRFLISIIRQYYLTIMQLAIPTPGGSGTAEMGFLYFFKDLVLHTESLPLIAAIWRIETFYYYIIIGLILFPLWLKKQTTHISTP